MKKISVVMPVHNTGILLKKSIGSLVIQSMEDFELICVDDGSDDAVTLQILKSYEGSCPFFKPVYLEKSVGAAEARNIGLNMAVGEYVIFLDSDDEFDEFLLETMYERAIRNNADICCCGYEEFYEDGHGRHSLGMHFPKESGNITQECFALEDLDESALTLWTSAPWKLFRRDFVRQNRISFQTLSSSNDVYFSCMTAILARRICYTKCDRPLIFYRQSVENQISANRNPENILEAVKWTMEDLKRRGLYSNNINRIFAFLYEHAAYELRTSRKEELCRKFYNDLRHFVIEHEGKVFLTRPEFAYFKDNLLKREYDSRWFLLIGNYRAQLEERADELEEKLRGYRRIALWGMGKRGEAFQNFCKSKDIGLAGIADRSNVGVGNFTKDGFRIIDKKDALETADMIVASNKEIYDSLLAVDGEIQCIDLSQYCPY